MSVCTSICSNGVGWSRSVQVMVGIGTPAEEQEMFTLSPSLSTTTPAPLVIVIDNTVVDLTQSGYPASGEINHCNPRAREYTTIRRSL